MSRKPVTGVAKEFERRYEHEFQGDPNPILALASAKEDSAERRAAAAQGLRALAAAAAKLDEMIPIMAKFASEREDLGEYDAGAAAIIEMAKTQLVMARIMRTWLEAHLDLELEG